MHYSLVRDFDMGVALKKPASNVQVAARGVPLAEVNLDTSEATDICQYVFQVSPLSM